MAKIVDMPKLSPTMEEGLLTIWHKKEGDTVKVDDLLAEVETDKATMEFRSFDGGTILKLLVPAGSTVKLGQPVAVIGNPGESYNAVSPTPTASATPAASYNAVSPTPLAAASPAASYNAVSPTPLAAASPAASSQNVVSAAASISSAIPAAASNSSPQTMPTLHSGSVLSRTERDVEAPAAADGRVLASPYVRKTARDLGIDLSQARGTGPHGRIVAEDLTALQSKGGAAIERVSGVQALATLPPRYEARPLSPMRKTIARRLTESKQNVPHFYLNIDVRVDPFMAFREKINGELAAGVPEERRVKISLNDLLIKACATALRRVPDCNASFTPEAIHIHDRVDISVAVAIPDGLVTPVIRDADKKSVVSIAQEIRDLAGRARQKKLKPEEMQDGTFSISNLGMFGIDQFAAVINPPEGAILAVGQARDEAIVEDGVVKPGKKLALTLSCDHRVVDGAVGASFLAELRSLIEHPFRILTG
jgi:pyruvate dehydrogenase E2 component (dihydrolipoamide acetyltransferase)